MLFKELKEGYPIYILHKDGEKRVSQGKVTNVSPSHMPTIPNVMNTMQMVVDITVDDNGCVRTYTMPDNLSVTYTDNLVLSTDKEGVIREVEVIKSKCEEELSRKDEYEKTVLECDNILKEWNPTFKEKKETEARFEKLETSVHDIKDMLSGLIKELKT